MVLADSHRISRVLWYLGDQTGSQHTFAYRTITFYGPTSQTVRLACWFLTPRPCGLLDPATPPHASVLGFRLFPVRSPLLGESRFLSLPGGTEMSHFPPLASIRLCIQRRMAGQHPAGFPHSDIPGSKLVCSSPRLIAAYHVLHRLLVPRHPPCALSSLTGISKVLSLCITQRLVFGCQ
jgi:hypothetical protein